MAELGEAGRPSVVIRKYANRRLYDTSRSRYVTLDDVARMVGEGTRVRVLAAGKGTDLTRQILAQIIFERERESSDGLLDETVLHRLIRLRRHPERGVLSRHIAGALDAFANREGPKITPRPVGDDLETDRAHARIDALQERLRKLIEETERKGD
jgi:polyhydroxyalkanoate synthesis repressor PhaR